MNATAYEEYVLVNNVRGANVSDQNYTLHWASAIPSDTAQYTLVFLDYATGGYAGQSAIFNLTLPAGETRDTNVGNAPASPGTTSTAEVTAGGLSSGPLAAAIVVPILAVIVILIGVYFFWRRKRSPQTDSVMQDVSKVEMDGQGMPDKDTKHESAELATKDYMNWELPTTPEQKAMAPQELPAEVPLVEMSAGEDETTAHKHPSGISDNATTSAGSASGDKTESVVSPLMLQDGFPKNSFQQSVRSSLQSPMGANASRSVAATTTNHSRFEEALYDLISDQLRRPDP